MVINNILAPVIRTEAGPFGTLIEYREDGTVTYRPSFQDGGQPPREPRVSHNLNEVSFRKGEARAFYEGQVYK